MVERATGKRKGAQGGNSKPDNGVRRTEGFFFLILGFKGSVSDYYVKNRFNQAKQKQEGQFGE